MYDQFRFQGFKIKFTPNITGANANYMTYTRWFRDAAPASTYIVPNTDFKAPTGFSPLILFGLRKEVQIVNAQSTQSRYINNNVQNNMYGSIYATDIQEKSSYVPSFKIYEMLRDPQGAIREMSPGLIDDVNAALDTALEFYPTWVIHAPSVNVATIDLSFEVTINLTVRGAAVMNPLVEQSAQPV